MIFGEINNPLFQITQKFANAIDQLKIILIKTIENIIDNAKAEQ